MGNQYLGTASRNEPPAQAALHVLFPIRIEKIRSGVLDEQLRQVFRHRLADETRQYFGLETAGRYRTDIGFRDHALGQSLRISPGIRAESPEKLGRFERREVFVFDGIPFHHGYGLAARPGSGTGVSDVGPISHAGALAHVHTEQGLVPIDLQNGGVGLVADAVDVDDGEGRESPIRSG
jgi:hypothetical protein